MNTTTRTQRTLPMQRSTSRSIIYTRVSTDEQAGSGLGLEAQADRCRAYAEAHGYEPITLTTDAGVSGTVTPDEREGLGAALAALDAGDADVLIAASLSRIGRCTTDVLMLADRADRNGWSLVVLDLNLDTRTPAGRLFLTVMAALAEFERNQTAERTRDALAAAKRRGQRLGAPVSDATRTAGPRAAELHADGLSWRKVAAVLDREGYRRRNSTQPWTAAAASRAAGSVAHDQAAADAGSAA